MKRTTLKKNDSLSSEASVDFSSVVLGVSTSIDDEHGERRAVAKKKSGRDKPTEASRKPTGKSATAKAAAGGKGKGGKGGTAKVISPTPAANECWRTRANRKRKQDAADSALAHAKTIMTQFEDEDQVRTLKVSVVQAAVKKMDGMVEIDGSTLSLFKNEFGLLNAEGQELLNKFTIQLTNRRSIASILEWAFNDDNDDSAVDEFAQSLAELEKPDSPIKPCWYIQQKCILAVARNKFRDETLKLREEQDVNLWAQHVMMKVLPTAQFPRRISAMRCPDTTYA